MAYAAIMAMTVKPPRVRVYMFTSFYHGWQGQPLTWNLDATGGVEPYTWMLDSGSLPEGLTLYASGYIYGHPTDYGTWEFTVRVRPHDTVVFTPVSPLPNA